MAPMVHDNEPAEDASCEECGGRGATQWPDGEWERCGLCRHTRQEAYGITVHDGPNGDAIKTSVVGFRQCLEDVRTLASAYPRANITVSVLVSYGDGKLTTAQSAAVWDAIATGRLK